MCFSAQASFIAAGSLTVAALISIKYARTTTERLIAYTPLIFALQQVCEGIVWLSNQSSGIFTSYLNTLGIYGFLFFAFIWWPIWIPLALYAGEPKKTNKRLILPWIFPGILFSGTLIILLSTLGAQATNAHYHIIYSIPISYQLTIMGILIYSSATIVPMFISSIPCMRSIGLVTSISLLVSLMWYSIYFVSIWCFFAALTSGIISFCIIRGHLHKV